MATGNISGGGFERMAKGRQIGLELAACSEFDLVLADFRDSGFPLHHGWRGNTQRAGHAACGLEVGHGVLVGHDVILGAPKI